MKSLLIVESPAKVKTLSKFLGRDFTIKSSVGHIKDLPRKELGVDVDNNFTPTYVTINGKEKVLRELKKEAKRADRIYLGPDPDREGEAIAWHIAEELNGEAGKVFRVEFNEITERAVKDAIQHPRTIDRSLFDAQQARRVLDRLVGYKLSPLLWAKLRRGLSAGRVQSVALRLVVDREREIEAFVQKEYWSITAVLEGAQPPVIKAKLSHINGRKISIGDEEQAASILKDLDGATYVVQKVEKKQRKRLPAPPFITSTLQQEASRRHLFGAQKTMVVAQQLYEGIDLGSEGPVGLITYMRTDSVRVAAEAGQEAREYIRNEFGKDFVPRKPVVYKSKKSAQDAHEAIRPTSITRSPESVKAFLTKEQYYLYRLVWIRFLASQMSPAVLDQTSVHIAAGMHMFRASGSVVTFQGFMKLYTESTEEASEEEGTLPLVREGELLHLVELTPKQHFTQPPPRYTEAMLVREMEAKGIGRPSTYASILSKIMERQYTEKIDRKLKATELGCRVIDYLIANFPNSELMDVGFTAKMEEELDSIEEGASDWINVIKNFYLLFNRELEVAGEGPRAPKPPEIPTDVICKECGKPMVNKSGRFGRFLACSGYPECKYTKPLGKDESDDESKKSEAQITEETCQKCGSPMVLKSGRFGQFLACSTYPTCKTTKAIGIGVTCPEDGGEIVERRTKKGKLFYSCNNYPKCKFATWYKPVAVTCPGCGAGIMIEKRTKKEEVRSCLKKECGYKEELKQK